MARVPEYEKGRTVSPRRTAERKRAAEIQRSGPFKQYVEQFENKSNSHPQNQNSQSLPQANPKTIYEMSGSVKISGDQFPEGVLPANAIPIGKTTFFSRLLSKLGLTRQQK